MFVCPLPTDPINLFRLKIFYLCLPARFYFILFFVPTKNLIFVFPPQNFFTGILRFYLSCIRSSPFGITWAFDMNEHLHLEFQSICLKSMLKALKSWFNERYSVSLYMKSRVHSKKVCPILNYQRVYKIFCKRTLFHM